MIHGITNISIPHAGYTMAQGSKVSFLVDPSSLIYSHFQNVSGIAAPEGTQGIAISKLNLLDVLIEQLKQVKKGEETFAQLSEDRNSLLPDLENGQSSVRGAITIDSMIENFNDQIRQAKSAQAAMPYIHSPSAQSGLLFSLFA